MVKRFFAALVAAIFAALALVAPAQAAGSPASSPASANPAADLPPVLKVGTEGVYAPFSFHDSSGQLTGFDIEVMNAIGAKLGVKIEYVETPWDSMFAALAAKRFDVVANQVTANPERAALYDLSSPYVETTGVVVVAENNTTIKGLADLQGKRAAENLTSNWSEVAKGAGATIVGVEGMTEALTNLKQGRVDVVVNDKLAIGNYLATTSDPGVKIVAQTEDTSESVLAARKGSGYLPELNAAIAQLKADGTIQGIYDKYFSAKPKATTTWDLIKANAWPMLKALIKTTIPLTLISFVIGLVIALGVALARMSSSRIASGAARFYISLIRGTPLLVQLFLIFYALPQFGVKIDPFPAAVIAFSLNVGGYAAEIIRSAIESLPKGQWEAASTIGMNYATTLRRVILPQAARTAVPPLSNTLISLVKDTSLASAILVPELLRQAQVAAAPTFQFFAMYGVAAIYYWVVCLGLSTIQSRLETRLNRFVAS